jgi:hypothetical protein
MKRTVSVFAIMALGVAAVLIPVVAQAAKPVPSVEEFFGFGPQAQLQWAGTQRDVDVRGQQMVSLQGRLVSQDAGAADRALEIRLSAAEQQRIDSVGRSQGKYFVGIDKALGLNVDLNGPGRAAVAKTGSVQQLGENGRTWTFALNVPNATALRLHLTGVNLPPGAELYVYNVGNRQVQAFGPYTGRGPNGNGDLYTNTVFGEQIRLQLVQTTAAPVPAFEIESVGVMGQRFLAPRYNPEGAFSPDDNYLVAALSNLCSFNADCIENAACTSSSAVNDAKQAIASILFQSGGGYYICTGGLIAHNGDSNVIPYFLTAHHCIGSSNEASSVETYFDYTTTCNSPNCTQPYNNTGETVGSTLLATGSSSDYSLLQLSSTPVSADGITAYLGWDSSDISNSSTDLYRISHPQGAPQAYSEQTVDANAPTCRTLPRGDFLYSRDTVGATEGGSSGSPVVNGSGQVVGQLYGACGTNLNDVCDSANNATVDGAFHATFPNVSQWLDPGSGPTCSQAGASCSNDSDCCSNKCKGKPGSKTCK